MLPRLLSYVLLVGLLEHLESWPRPKKHPQVKRGCGEKRKFEVGLPFTLRPSPRAAAERAPRATGWSALE